MEKTKTSGHGGKKGAKGITRANKHRMANVPTKKKRKK